MESNYAISKTPRRSALSGPTNLQQELESSARDASIGRHSLLVKFAQLIVVVAIGVCVYGQIMVFTDYYNLSLKVVISAWWGVPKAQALANGGGGGITANAKGHPELVRPTFVFLFFALPLVVSLLLVEYLRNLNVRRATSEWALELARVLRRKPSIGAKVSSLSYGELLFLIVFLIGGNVLAFYYGFERRYRRALETAAKTKKHSIEFNEYLDMVAITLGFNCIYNMVFLFLPATRNAVWSEFLNISYANAVKYHRWLGVVTVLTAFAHAVSFYWLWIREGIWKEQALPCFDCSLKDRASKQVWMNVFGQLAILCFLLIGVTSIPWVRRNVYNVFYLTHHAFVPAVIFAVLHWAPIVWWIYPSFVLYAANRAFSSSNAFQPVEVKEFTLISEHVVKLVLARSTTRSGEYKIGQFVYLNVPVISKLQWHAFTLASSPKTNARMITVLIKSLGDWTSELAKHVGDCKQQSVAPVVYLDGYYGASLELYSEYSSICLIGGGIGVTPLIAILEDVAAKLHFDQALSQRAHFVFSFRELAMLEEISPLLTRIREHDPQGHYFKLHLSLTQEPLPEVLDQVIGANTTRNHIQPTHPTINGSSSAKQSFAEPLRGRGTRSLVYVTVFFVTFALIVFLEFGSGKIKGHGHDSLWMLQQFVEAMVLFVGAFVVLGFAAAERYLAQHSRDNGPRKVKDPREDYDVRASVAHNPGAAISSAAINHLHTYRDLLHDLDVAVGHRHEIAEILKQAVDEQEDAVGGDACVKSSVVGVFVSGPSSLVSATERAVAVLGASRFDIHEEEFEL